MRTHRLFILTFIISASVAGSATAETTATPLTPPRDKFFQLRPYVSSQPISRPEVKRPQSSRAINQVLGRRMIENAPQAKQPEPSAALEPLFDNHSNSTPVAPLSEDVVLSVFDPRPDIGDTPEE